MRLIILTLLLLFSYSSVDAQNVKPIRVLTWNIYMRPAFLFWNGQFKRAKAIGETLKQEHYDIILFQEAFGKTSRKKIRKVLGETYPYEIEPQRQKTLINSGLWILSKHKITESEMIFFNSCLVSDCHSSKGAVLIEVVIDGSRFQFVNTHVQAEDGKEFAKVRSEQFEMINQLLQQKDRAEIPQFICGDLNTNKTEVEEYTTMLKTLKATDGNVSVLDNTEFKNTTAATWDADSNDLIAKKWRGMSQLLDYGLQRENTPPFKLRRELKTYTQQWSKRRKHLSDHYAISLTILP